MKIKSNEEICKRFEAYKKQIEFCKSIQKEYGKDYAAFPKISTLLTEPLCASLIINGQIPLKLTFDVKDIVLHGKGHNDIWVGKEEISVKATAAKGQFTWFSDKDFEAINIWIDFYPMVHLEKPIIPVTIFYNLKTHLPKEKAKVVFPYLLKIYPKEDLVIIPSVKFDGIN